jgi:hypothetical protein
MKNHYWEEIGCSERISSYMKKRIIIGKKLGAEKGFPLI